MIQLRYSSGKVMSEDVHKVGLLALGSHLETMALPYP